MPSVFEALADSLSPDTVEREASRLRESPARVSRGLQAAVRAILMGVLAKNGQPKTMRALFSSFVDSPDAATLHTAAFLALLFGERLPAIQAVIASASGLQPSSAGALVALAAPLVLSTLRREVEAEGLSMYGLFDWLSVQRSAIVAGAPRGLSEAVGLSGGSSGSRAAVTPMKAPRSGRQWSIGALALALLAIALLGWLRVHRPATNVAARIPSGGDAAALGAWTVRKLPSDVQMRVPVRGLENRVINFLEDRSRADVARSFDFDRLSFDAGAATLRPESDEQLRNVAEILKAYPDVRATVGGHTDDSGDANANMRLSMARAQNVRRELVTLGVDAARIAADGYGASQPVARNDTEAGRAANRRLSLLVTDR
jgi:OmpA-OmpF porin, OOP family